MHCIFINYFFDKLPFTKNLIKKNNLIKNYKVVTIETFINIQFIKILSKQNEIRNSNFRNWDIIT